MPSLRSRFWASTISKIIDNAPEINHPNDIRRDFSEDRISFLRVNLVLVVIYNQYSFYKRDHYTYFTS